MLLQRNITVIVGHYGSGKTELAVNLALDAAAQGTPPTLVDLDIVNPYFCSREREQELTQAGVRVIAPADACRSADVPALPADVARIFVQPGLALVDAGGDDVGARVLSRYNPQFLQAQPDVWLVLNANRPQTATCEGALQYLARIEEASRLKITGVLNNTHLCGQTTSEDVLRGNRLAQAVCAQAGLALVANAAPRALAQEAALRELPGGLFSIDIHMKKPWEFA